jgi:hypothetical protein
MAIASLGGMSPAPTELTIGRPRSGLGGGLGGGSAQDGLGQINTGAQTVGSAIGQAAAALGTGGGGGGSGASLNTPKFDPATGTFTSPLLGMKSGGKVKSKAKGGDWHGFGKSSSGNNKHGF